MAKEKEETVKDKVYVDDAYKVQEDFFDALQAKNDNFYLEPSVGVFEMMKAYRKQGVDFETVKTGIGLIAAERIRQVEKEGWSAEHDDEHTSMCLATAGASYALDAVSRHADVAKSWKETFNDCANRIWPFDQEMCKPTPEDPIRQLVKAGALIAAEIDRLNRVKQE